jgi:excisionase family DNA binding protein
MSRTKRATDVSVAPELCPAASPQLAYGIVAAASALDLSRSRIYELISEGEIGACKIGKRTVIPASELTAFLDRHRVIRLSAEIATATLRGRWPCARRAVTRCRRQRILPAHLGRASI